MSIAGKILVIDDNELVLERVKARLLRESYDVMTTVEPVGVASHLPLCDIVILDFHMPGMNGREVLQSLKTIGADTEAKPLYFLYTSDSEASRGYKELGFDGTLVNKGNDESLVQQVSVALRLAKLRRKMAPAKH